MQKINFIRLLILLMIPFVSSGQTNDNEELRKMYEADQNARMVPNIDWTIVSKDDSAREKRVYQLIDEGKLITGKDYYYSAMIFQHGRDSVAYGMAVKQMRKAIELDSTVSKWLLAAAIDRDLMSRHKPQIYGTQYMKNGPNEKWKRYEIDTTVVSSKEREYYGVESLQEQEEKERNMNLLSISKYYATKKSLNETMALIKREKHAGKKSLYNVSESGINEFGYELVSNGHNNDALQVFTLNTQLYQNGYNTFDSLGECLLSMGRTKQAIEAYKKSLVLNPKNENAKAVIAGNQ